MFRKFLFVLFFVFSGALCAAGFYYGRQIPFSQQWPLFEALRNTAAIIFAVVGAWLAIIYPERLKISFGRNGTVESTNSNIGLLLTPAVHSTIILVVLLLIGVIAPLLKQVPLLSIHIELLRGLSFLILTALTLWQVLIVLMTVIPAGMVKHMADTEQAKKDVQEHYSKLIKK